MKGFSYTAIFHMIQFLIRMTLGVVSPWDPFIWSQLSEETRVCPGSLLILCLAPLPQWFPGDHLPGKKWPWDIPFNSAAYSTRGPDSVIPKTSMSHWICTSFVTSFQVPCGFNLACPDFPEYIHQWLKNITDGGWIMSFWNLCVEVLFLRTSEWSCIWRWGL